MALTYDFQSIKIIWFNNNHYQIGTIDRDWIFARSASLYVGKGH